MEYLNKRIYLGPLQIRILSGLERTERRQFFFQDLVKVAPGTNRQVVRNVVAKLVAKGRLHRIKKGEYLLVSFAEEDYALHELVLAGHYYPEGYVSFLSALRFYGLTDQLPQAVQVVVKTPSKSYRFLGTKYQPVRLSKRYFLGYKTLDYAKSSVRMALREKAILDCLLHPEYCGGLGEVCKAIREAYRTLDWKSLQYFLGKMGNSAVERRLYYCLDFIGKKNKLPKKKFKGYRKLDSRLANRGRYSSKYGLLINTNLEEEMR